jgi:hypothetical protein
MKMKARMMTGVLIVTVFVVLVFAARATELTFAASPLFVDSFESKNFASWTGTRTTAGETMSVTNLKANDGVYSAFFSADGNQASGYAYAYKNLAPQTNVYEQGFILPATFVLTASNSRFYFAALAASKGDITVMAGCINSGSKISWRLALRVGTAWTIIDSSIAVGLNQWHAFELQWLQSSTSGYGKLYIDNTLVCSVSQVNTSAYGASTLAECGIVMSGNAKTTFYLDKIQISNVPFGSTTPNPPPNPLPDPTNYYKGFIVSPSTMKNRDQKGNYFGYSDLQQMKNWGATAVRIHDVYAQWIMPTKGTFDLAFFQKYLDVYAQNCKQLGLYCIIDLGDLQWSGYFGSGYGMPSWFFQGKYPTSSSYRNIAARDFWDLNNPLQAENRQWFIKWWQFIADRYKSNPWVMFSIYNEPLNPGINACATESEVQRLNVCYSSFMEQVYDAIRATGANQTVIVNQPWAHSLQEIVRVNRTITWDFHMYVGQTFSITQWTNSFIQERNRYVNDFKQPFVMGEMGIYPDSASVYDALNYQAVIKSEVSALKNYGASGWFFLDWGALAGEDTNHLTATQTTNIANALFA